MMNRKPSRRTFVKTTAALGAGYWALGGVAPKESRAAIEEIRFACFGVGGKGDSDSSDASRNGKVVAICDINDQTMEKAAEKYYPEAKRFNDFRKLFDEMHKSFDAVTVSTPDHTHAVIAAMAMNHGKHVYCQKPLTRTIWEARRLAEIAKEKGVVTQMGNQGCALRGSREAIAKIRQGVLGTIKEVHVWTNRPVWPQGITKPAAEPIPSHIHWEEFLGPSPARDYSAQYTPFKWRGFWAFGTGALGDMACHTVNMPFAGCELVNPISVKATTSGHNSETYPSSSIIEFDFAKTDSRPPLKFFWYDGGRRPDKSVLLEMSDKMKDSGAVVIGDKGSLYSPADYGEEYFLIGGAKDIDVEVKAPPGGHFVEFARAIKANDPSACFSNFPNHAGKLTEVILLGNLAVWAAGTAPDGKDVSSPVLEWDQENMKIKGTDAYDAMIKPVYRDGYTL